jgi:hypothetical protein
MDGEVWEYDYIDGGSAVGRPNGTVGFAHYPFDESIVEFVRQGSVEVNRVSSRTDIERYPYPNLIRFSTLPWFDFTAISHARNFEFEDSAPRITFGKITESAGRRTLPVSSTFIMVWLMDRMWPNLLNDFTAVSTVLVTRLGSELHTTTVISLIASGYPADTEHFGTLPNFTKGHASPM